MEKIAVISDVHANKTALNAVLSDIKNRNIRRIICLGDIVSKGANPREVIDIVRANCEVILKGNCDEVMSSDRALERKFWTRMQIGEERAEFLRNLPIIHEFYLSGYLIRLFHASPYGLDLLFNPAYSNKENNYANLEIDNPLDLFKNTEFIGKTEKDEIPDIIGYGHIHTPNLVRYQNKLIFNTGSVGAPIEMLNKNEDCPTNKFSTVASYTILEGKYDERELQPILITNVRVPYNIDDEIETLKNSSMPGKEKIIKSLKTAISEYK